MRFRIMRKALGLWLVLVGVAAGQARPSVKSDSETYLLWHFLPSEGASPELAGRVEQVVRAHFQKRRGALLLGSMKMDSILLVEGNEDYLRCGIGAGCLAGLARLAKVAFVIAAEVALSKGRTFIRLYLVDANKQAVVSQAKLEFEELPDQAQLEELETAMFSPRLYKGSLEVVAAVQGAEVLVDGNKMGITPLPGPLMDLPAGQRLVEVKKPGHKPYAQNVSIPMGKSARVTARLPLLEAAAPQPYYKKWPFWTAAGTGVAALVAAGILYHHAGTLEDRAAACRRNHIDCVQENQDLADSRYLQSYLLFGVSGAGLLAAGLIMAIDLALTDKPNQHSPSMGLLPTPDGMVLSATWQF